MRAMNPTAARTICAYLAARALRIRAASPPAAPETPPHRAARRSRTARHSESNSAASGHRALGRGQVRQDMARIVSCVAASNAKAVNVASRGHTR